MKRFEVEIKFRDVDPEDLKRRLDESGAVVGPTINQADLYFAHPCRDFSVTDEAFRIRLVGEQAVLTYKGPKLSGATKTREEIEIPLAEGSSWLEQTQRMFERLGFEPRATVRKTRLPFELTIDHRRLEVSLDTVENIGTFAEIETISVGPDDLEPARTAVLNAASLLGLDEAQIERRSYLRMVLEGSP